VNPGWVRGFGSFAAAAAAAMVLAGCGSAAADGRGSVGTAPSPALSSAFATGRAGFAIVEMGGSARQHNNFWQLFGWTTEIRKWRLVTPPGVADNGGLVVAAGPGTSLVTGFRPSQALTFSPVARSADSGARWSAGAPVDPGLARAPDALAAGPAGQVIALTRTGGVELGTGLGAGWTYLTSASALARTPAGRACGLARLAAVGFTPTGIPLLAGDCAKPGMVGVFALHAGAWRPAGPALPAGPADRLVRVLGLRAAGTRTTLLLRVGAGSGAGELAAWSADGARDWRLSPLLRTGQAAVRAQALWADGCAALMFAGRRGAVIAGPAAAWRVLPALPAGTQTLAAGAGGRLDALAARGGTMAAWWLPAGATAWRLAQRARVTIPYGSSG
jgi:hypothetical protein